MTRKRRAVGTSIVLAAVVIAACLGPHLSSTAQESVVAAPTKIDFGAVPVGTASSDQLIMISPASGTGPSDDVVQSINASCSDFTVIGTIPADVFRHCGAGSGSVTLADTTGDPSCPDPVTVQIATFVASFHPAVAGAASCSVDFTGTFGVQTVLLQGTGVAPALAIDVSPKAIDFGDVRVATPSAPLKVTVKNAGSQPLQINGVSIAQPGAVFAITAGTTGTHTLAVNGVESFEVTCTPPTTQVHTGTLTVSSNATGTPNVDLPLSCRGTNSALTANPSPVDLDTRVGEPVQKVVTITNSGGSSATITGFAVTGHAELSLAQAPGVPITLEGSGANTTVTVRYSAMTAQAKTALGKLTIAHDGSAIDEVILSAEALATSISVNPDAVDFGPICAGTAASVDVKVFANAAGDFTVGMVTPPVAPFTFVAKPGTVVPGLVRGGHRNDFGFVAGVTPVAAGAVQSKAVLATDIPNMPTREIALHAQALAPGVSATPQQLDFGAVLANTTTPAQTVEVTNCGTSPLMVTGAHLEGPGANDFAIVSPADPARTLAPTTSMELLVVMTPRTAGAKVATLVVEYAGGTAAADLVGTALGAGGDDGDRRETYYRCSAGGAAGLGPVALALAALLRRRRRS